VGYAANILGTSAKVVMPKTANPYRISKCRAHGADVVLVDNVAEAFEKVSQIENGEGRKLVHPFEGPNVAAGTATVGLELCNQVPDLDAVIIPIGGGGLCAGIATAVKLMQPKCQVFGVEPEGADTMHRSFASGKTESIPEITTIADSLGSPRTEPYSFALCRRYVDQLVMVDDDQIREAMASLFFGLKMAVEPAGAAALAALYGPLREQLRGKKVGVIVSGTNIDPTSFVKEIKKVKW
jgi:threonine dehydratase